MQKQLDAISLNNYWSFQGIVNPLDKMLKLQLMSQQKVIVHIIQLLANSLSVRTKLKRNLYSKGKNEENRNQRRISGVNVKLWLCHFNIITQFSKKNNLLIKEINKVTNQ